MKKIFFAAVMIFALSNLVNAQTMAVKYLVLGADPQAKDRQPLANEEVVIIDADICDVGWGTGSGKKIAGCYPKNSAVIRDKETKVATAMFVCGNSPTEKHTVTGKVVPAGTVPPVFTGPQRVVVSVSGIPTSIAVHVDGKVEVVHSGTVDVNTIHSGEVGWRHFSEQPLAKQPSDKKKATCSKGCKIGIAVAVIGGGAVAGVVLGTRGHNNPTPGRPPGGNTGPNF